MVRDFYQKTDSYNASAALTKATLINSAVDLLDENNDGANDNDFPIPNVHEGWGLVNLAAATDGSHEYVDNTTGISTGNNSSYQFAVSTSGKSANLIYALEEARRRDLLTVAWAGKDGGRFPEVADYCFIVPSYSIHRIQEVHATLVHIAWDLIHIALGAEDVI